MYDDNNDNLKKLRAAYALNMCTVSVSQIIDYNDEYILEQEYEAILNNLNLEEMPKDEALLNILVKLLNVITFFRIDRVKRDQIEKKYQRRMKNAIWSAVPNIGVIVAGNPVTVGLSLATQVGIGYMNYRREKANITADMEDDETELRITAMEQLNALRRELFTTAWRLADKYNFPDRYRLTERQISQYNQILMDPDELRKYERLVAIQDKFEAYLPFWYFIGHSAKYISEDKRNGLEPAVRKHYRDMAKKHFEKFYSLNTFNLLREDELTASFALEYVDLLLLEEKPDKEKIVRLINTAVDMAGNANDVLELCMISYLKSGETAQAEKLLRILVNEDYNTATNSKLLSRIYVSEFLKGSNPLARTEYGILSARVPSEWLFPMPEQKDEDLLLQDKYLQDKYLSEQRSDLQKKYSEVLTRFIEKYIILFNRVILTPAGDQPDEYFAGTEEAFEKRRRDVDDELKSERGNEYRLAIRESGYRFRYVELINEMLKAHDDLSLFRDSSSKEYMILLIQSNLAKNRDKLKRIQEKLNQDGAFTVSDYEMLQKELSFQMLTKEFFGELRRIFMYGITEADSLDKLDELETDIVQFCRVHDIRKNESGAKKRYGAATEYVEAEYISKDVLGKEVKDEKESRRVFEEMIAEVKTAGNSIISDSSKVKFIPRGNDGFDIYFKSIRSQGAVTKFKALAIIEDCSSAENDLIITCEGVIPIRHHQPFGLRSFDRIEYQGRSIGIGWPEEFANEAVDIGKLYSMLEKLKEISNRSN